jgi:peptidoglycan/LPS O-acetylase OafA/YrhL
MNLIPYKDHIDGLRGIAILLVVIFHFFPDKLPAGFIGVDIFFVISGYLMTAIITTEIQSNRFNLVCFYKRRIKRLFPSILFTLLLCLLFGYFFLNASEYKELSKETVGALTFVSNFVFLNESGYFNQDSLQKPLLHFWSLGIEEQFYLIWPLVIFLISKYKKNYLYSFIVIFTASFLCNLFFFFKGHTNLDFYSPFTRIWELVFGGIIASSVNTKSFKNLFSYAGFLLLLLSLILINNSEQYPGYFALLPIFSSGFLINSNPNNFLISLFLRNKLIKWLGKISYPFYLVHWPIIVFYHSINGQIEKNLRFPLLLISLILAYVLHFIIENPIRYTAKKYTVTLLLSTNILIALFSLLAVSNNGIILNKPISVIEQKNIKQLTWLDNHDDLCEKITHIHSLFCKIYGNPNNITTALIGDSTANHLAPGLYNSLKLIKKDQGLINVGEGTCPIIKGLISTKKWGGPDSGLSKNCIEITTETLNYLNNNKNINLVVMAFFLHDIPYWGIPKKGNSDKTEILSELIKRQVNLFTLEGKNLIITFDSPYVVSDINRCLKPTLFNTQYCKNQSKLVFDTIINDKLFFLLENSMIVFDQKNTLEKLKINKLYDDNDHLILRDNHHYSYFGSDLIGSELANLIKQKYFSFIPKERAP